MEILVDGLVVLVDEQRFTELGCPRLAVYADGRGGVQHVRILGQKKTVFLHKEIFGAIAVGYVVDHINGNVLDNRMCNLRLATKQQNTQNNEAGRKGTSKYPGVSWYKKLGKWRAAISIKNTKKHLGYFQCELEAARAVKKAALKQYGEFSIYTRFYKEL